MICSASDYYVVQHIIILVLMNSSDFAQSSLANSDLAINPEKLSHADAKSLCSRLLSTASSHLEEEYPDTVKYLAQSLQKVLSRSRIVVPPD